ncbi:hypothetical protein [Spirosoma endbachense]|uniref:DUF5683 domain-containing protein n=1 Tax=Spirosoma endbachense TaxID=2666025 RepID=A0A6P1VVF6_9BACT|nr:hypothetical protein [Spirosoma endbachense]QHV96072.1 hypothetical protein GJR95_14120 [Spirosoma endbachense]
MNRVLYHRLFPFLVILLTSLAVHAQQAPSEATNIRISPDEKTRRLVIQYDLLSVQPGDSLYVEIETASGRHLRPISVSGNVGKAITAGRNKTIYWDIVRDKIQLDEEVEVIIRLVRGVNVTRPATAAKPKPPVPAPVVSVQKKSPLPIIGWIATGGLAAYTFVLASGLNKDVDAYNQKTVANTLAEWNTAEDKRKDIDSRRGTVTIVAGATAALLIANIVYTVVRKSNQNSKPNQLRTAWQIRPASQSMGVGLVHTF